MTEALLAQLDSFDAGVRSEALRRLKALADAGRLRVERPAPLVNLHCHTFFSYNAYGYSPSRFAWEAYRRGLAVAGIVDFDCLDGAAEFMEAGRLLGLKTCAGFETRVFIRERSDKVINSPGEPGVYYLVGLGFVSAPDCGTGAAQVLASMARRARQRNIQIMHKINDYLGEVTIDYEEDVLPLTPAGNATERHMLQAYENKARQRFPHAESLARFWSEKLNEDKARVLRLLDDTAALKELIRARLMKFGGVGYPKPERGSFPSLEEVVQMTLECGAVPSGCWLDGTTECENDPLRHFGFLKEKGIPTITMIPNRNWDIADADEKRLKLGNLDGAVRAAVQLEMPIMVGTEMNRDGQRFVDAFHRPELAPYRQVFLNGAHVAWGHTLLRMTAGVGYTGQWAEAQFGSDTGSKNDFFRRAGAAPYPDQRIMQRLCEAGSEADPGDFLNILNVQ